MLRHNILYLKIIKKLNYINSFSQKVLNVEAIEMEYSLMKITRTSLGQDVSNESVSGFFKKKICANSKLNEKFQIIDNVDYLWISEKESKFLFDSNENIQIFYSTIF